MVSLRRDLPGEPDVPQVIGTLSITTRLSQKPSNPKFFKIGRVVTLTQHCYVTCGKGRVWWRPCIERLWRGRSKRVRCSLISTIKLYSSYRLWC